MLLLMFLVFSGVLGVFQSKDNSIFKALEAKYMPRPQQVKVGYGIEILEFMQDSGTSLQELQTENSNLLKQQSDLEAQISDAQNKMNAYLDELNGRDTDLQQKITTLDNYNHQIQRSQEKTQTDLNLKETSDKEQADHKENTDDAIALSELVIIVVALGFIFLLLSGIKKIIGFSIQSFLNKAFYCLFIDLTILLLICGTITMCDYYNIITDSTVDYRVFTLGAALFTFFFLLFGLWLILAVQAFSGTWIRHERSCQDLRNLTHMFQEVQIELSEGHEPVRMKEIYKDCQYAIMRQLFICPTFLPTVTETYLRTDFNLSDYLSRCAADIIENVFNIGWLGYSFIVIGLLIWRAVLYYDSTLTKIIAFWALPGFIAFVCGVIVSKLNSIYNKLVPEPTGQIVLNFPRDNFGTSPEMNEEIVSKPLYLSGKFYPNDSVGDYVNCCFFKVHPLKLTWAFIISGTYPNRHELLFWGDKYGVDIIIGILQGIYICLSLWIAVVLIYYIDFFNNELKWEGIVQVIICLIVWVFIAGYLVPEIIRLLSLTTKIEMKKDRKIIEEVIMNEKFEKSKVINRVYRQFKMIYREKYGERVIVNDEIINKYALEVFGLYKDEKTNTVDVEYFEDMISLCGIKLDDDELRLLAKEAKIDKNKEITPEGFCEAIGIIVGSSELRPEFVTRVVLTRYFQESKGKNVKDVSLEELKQFFNEFWIHFTDEDVQDFLWETRFVLEEIGSAEISELAGMIKNNVKDFPR
jgi:hypothetical protein